MLRCIGMSMLQPFVVCGVGVFMLMVKRDSSFHNGSGTLITRKWLVSRGSAYNLPADDNAKILRV